MLEMGIFYLFVTVGRNIYWLLNCSAQQLPPLLINISHFGPTHVGDHHEHLVWNNLPFSKTAAGAFSRDVNYSPCHVCVVLIQHFKVLCVGEV